MTRKTIIEIYSEWKREKSRLVKASTLSTYAVNAEKHILPVFGASSEILDSDVQSFAFDMIERGLSVSTVKDILLVLKMINIYGAGRGWMELHGWNVRLPKDDRKNEPDVLTLAQQKLLMDYLSKHFSFRNLGLYLCLCTGLRIGEICALRWDDVCVKERTLKVRRTIERVYVVDDGRRYTKVVISTPKTSNSVRNIPIGGELLRMLLPLKKVTAAESFVITNSLKPLEPRLYRRHFKLLMDSLGMSKVRFHGLRHTFATRCIESNCDYKTVSSLLGHSSVSTTLNLYVHPDMTQKRKCIDRMLRAVT